MVTAGQLVTSVDFAIAAEGEQALLDGFRALNETASPDGLLRTELLRAPDGRWRIQTTWRDKEAVMALRASGKPPAVLELLDRLGAAHTHSVFTVEQSYGS